MAPKMPNVTPARDVLDARTAVGSKINVLGIVVDFRAPVPTRGKGEVSHYRTENIYNHAVHGILTPTDYKAQIRLYDQSIQDDLGESLLLNIFRTPDQMPDPNCGDVVLIFGAKVCSQLLSGHCLPLTTRRFNGTNPTLSH